MEGLLFFRVYPSDGFRFILIPDGNPSQEFPVLDGNPSSNMNSANGLREGFSFQIGVMLSIFRLGLFYNEVLSDTVI
jgi:hypothetical protein